MNDVDLIKSKLLDIQCSDPFIFSALENIKTQLDLLEKLQETLYNSELYLVYKHTSPTGKVYIGITKNLPNIRWNEGAGYETQRKFYKAIQKFGWINFSHEIIAAGLTEEEAKKLERSLILEFRSNEATYGYNTQVLHIDDENTKSTNNTIATTNISIDMTEIAKKLIALYSIKTVNGTIYYILENKYVSEKDFPIIKKELLITYGLESRKHREVIEQIKILSFARKGELIFESNSASQENTNFSGGIADFFKSLSIDESNEFYISDDMVYDNYIKWAQERMIEVLPKEKLNKKTINWMKHRSDMQRIITSTQKGWEMRAIIPEEKVEKALTQKGTEILIKWLSNTQENIICIPMICEIVFGLQTKPSRKLSNEICFVIRYMVSDWEEAGIRRFQKYGNQKYFKRKI